ncbi:MAG: GNAT family N-acetyltransferase [Actinoallomurus sp.]
MTVGPIAPDDPLFGPVGELFDAYRAHYGQDRSPHATRRWLGEQVAGGRLRVAAAAEAGEAHGLITTTVVPASLTLRTVWMIRDLYVDPARRRSGVARALLRHVAEAARAEGAHRLSLQTETGNTAALRLYESAGFLPVEGLELLNHPLRPAEEHPSHQDGRRR